MRKAAVKKLSKFVLLANQYISCINIYSFIKGIVVRELNKGLYEIATLSVIKKEAPTYGLEILNSLKASDLKISSGSLYPLLIRLERKSYINSEWVHKAEQKHPRKYYSISAQGQKRLSEMLNYYYECNKNLESLLPKR